MILHVNTLEYIFAELKVTSPFFFQNTIVSTIRNCPALSLSLDMANFWFARKQNYNKVEIKKKKMPRLFNFKPFNNLYGVRCFYFSYFGGQSHKLWQKPTNIMQNFLHRSHWRKPKRSWKYFSITRNSQYSTDLSFWCVFQET